MLKFVILLFVVGAFATAPFSSSLDFTGSYLVTGTASNYAVELGEPKIRDSYIAFDKVGKRIAWENGAGGKTWFREDSTYGIIPELAPGVCFIVRDRNGTNITYQDEVNGYKLALYTRNTILDRTIKVRNAPGIIKNYPLLLSKSLSYFGPVDDAQRCGLPVVANVYVDIALDFVTGIDFTQPFKVPVAPGVFATLTTYLSASFDKVVFGVPDESYFELPAECDNPIDFCDYFGGYN